MPSNRNNSSRSDDPQRRSMLYRFQVRAKRAFYRSLIRIMKAALDEVVYAPRGKYKINLKQKKLCKMGGFKYHDGSSFFSLEKFF